jgi:AI-2 transport protein TqsA
MVTLRESTSQERPNVCRFSRVFENKIDVPRFISDLDHMMHAFVVGNLVVGSVMAGGTSVVFLILGIKNVVTLGIVTAVLNLIPFFGVILASVAALAAALVQFDTVGPFIVILMAIPFLHFVAANRLIPRLIGSRVSVGPVAVTVGMLFWGWLWGAIGLLLAVPLTAFVKLIADSQPALAHLSNILAETPRL